MGALALSACSFRGLDEGSSVSLHFEFHDLKVGARSSYLFNSFLLPPSTAAGFDCLAVNVMGDGISGTGFKNRPEDQSNPQSNPQSNSQFSSQFCSYSGVTSMPIAFGENTVFDLTVPVGSARRIQVLGLVDTGFGFCKSSSTLAQTKEIQGTQGFAFELGSTTTDLFSNKTVAIENQYEGLSEDERKKRDVGCGQKAGRLSFKVQPSDTIADNAITPVIEVLDSEGNRMTDSSAEVTLSLLFLAAAGIPSTEITKTNADHGLASFGQSFFRTVGSYQLSVSSPGLESATSSVFSVSAGTATKLGFLTQPGPGPVPTSTTLPAIMIAVQDAYGNTATTSSASIGVAIANSGTNPGGGALTGGGATSAVTGVATFSSLKIDKEGSGYTLKATSGVLTEAVSESFTVKEPPVITSIFPSSGPLAGGTALLITGSNFSAADSKVQLNGVDCPLDSSATQTLVALNCITPSHAAGVVTVTVTNPLSQAGSISNAFEYYSNVPTAVATPNLKLWLKADVGVSRDTSINPPKVNSWTGRTASDTDSATVMSPGNSAYKPTYLLNAINGNPSVYFSGNSSEFLQSNDNLGNPAGHFTIFVVAQNDGASLNTAEATLLGLNQGGEYSLMISGGAYGNDNQKFGVNIGYIPNASTNFERVWTDLTHYHLISLVVNKGGIPPNILRLFFDGTDLGTGVCTNSPHCVDGSPISSSSGGDWNKPTVGNLGNQLTDGVFKGYIAEVLAYSSALSNADRTAIENYLNVKYALYPPKILALSRWSDTEVGGKSLTVRGAGFRQGVAVKLGETDCTPTTFVSASELTCQIPGHAVGVVSVKVTNPDGKTAEATNAFKYEANFNTNPPDVNGLRVWLRADSNSTLGDNSSVDRKSVV